MRVAREGFRVVLNPRDDAVLEADDYLIVISEDHDSYAPFPKPVEARAMREVVPRPSKDELAPEKILFCGWRSDMGLLVSTLDEFVPPGSELWIHCVVPEEERTRSLRDEGLDFAALRNVRIHHSVGDPLSRNQLESLPVEEFKSGAQSRR